jgi:hypothetical protein
VLAGELNEGVIYQDIPGDAPFIAIQLLRPLQFLWRNSAYKMAPHFHLPLKRQQSMSRLSQW